MSEEERRSNEGEVRIVVGRKERERGKERVKNKGKEGEGMLSRWRIREDKEWEEWKANGGSRIALGRRERQKG